MPEKTASEQDVYGVVVGQMISQLRARLGWSQAELAARVGVGQATISRVEKGQTLPDAYLIRRLAEAFDMHPAELQRLVDEAVDATGETARRQIGERSPAPWWQAALAVAGLVGLVAVVALAVATVIAAFGGAIGRGGRGETNGRSRSA